MPIEPLEARIAPASLTFRDLDGDLVTISASKGTRDQLVTATGGGAGLLDHQLQVLDLSFTTAFDGATISITATPQAGQGDGFVNVGYINAGGRVLGSVTVDGDLGVIDVGNTTKSAYALQTLTVHSMGLLGTSTGAPSGLTSDFDGSVRAITVKTDLNDVYLRVTGVFSGTKSSLGALTIGGSLRAPTSTGLGEVDVVGNIGPVKIGGSVIGGALANSGRIHAGGSMGSVTIGGDLIGGTATVAGSISADTTMGDVSIGGDLRGGLPTGTTDFGAGEIFAANGMGNLKIGGSIIGSGKDDCGSVRVGGLKNVTLGGSLIGGAGVESGSILVFINGNIGNVTIGGDVKGAGGARSGGVIALDGNIGNVTIRGTVQGGLGAHAGSILASTAEGTHGTLGAVKIGGDLRGGGNSSNDLSGSISAHDTIASVSIGGTVQGSDGYQSGSIVAGKIGAVSIYKRLSGGFGTGGGSIISDTDIGAVTIGDDVSGGVASGVFIAEATGTIFANGSIASVTVGGSLIGNTGDFSASIRAKSIGPVKIYGDVTGSAGKDSGSIQGIDKITSVAIGGTLRGGDLTRTGSIYAIDGIIGSVSIGGNLYGGGNVGGDQYAGSIVGHAVGSVTIHGDVAGSAGNQSGAILTETTIGNVTIGGSLIGNAAVGSGRIAILITPEHPIGGIGNVSIGGSVRAIGGLASGGIYGAGVTGEHLGAVKIGGDWEASSGNNSGQINFREVTSITLEGSLIGGRFADHAGYWTGDKVGAITIGGDLVGGAFNSSGALDFTSSTSVRIEGSIIGGTADFAGSVRGKAGTIVIGHDIRGGGNASNTDVYYNGSIIGSSVTSITIGGSLIAGFKTGPGGLTDSGAIVVDSIGSLVIKGSVVGNTTHAATIVGSTSIKTLNVAGRVEFGLINLYARGAQLGTLTVTGDWIASDVNVGLGYHSNFGNGNAVLSPLPGGNPNVVAKIASIVIGGQVLGTANPSLTFGFGAEEVTSFKVNGFAYKLKPGAHTDNFASTGHAGNAVAVGVTPANLITMDDGYAVHIFEL